MNQLYPIFLKLNGRNSLVVGGGRVALRKTQGLIKCEARVTVVAPEALEELARMADEGAIKLCERGFAPEDLNEVELVMVATNREEVNRAVAREARKRNIFCNVADVPDLCDFYLPSVVERGELKIALSSNGRAPALMKALRRLFEAELGPETERVFDLAGQLRDRVREQYPHDIRKRTEALEHLLRPDELVQALVQNNTNKINDIKEAWTSYLSD